jgi:hypothetical protein
MGAQSNNIGQTMGNLSNFLEETASFEKEIPKKGISYIESSNRFTSDMGMPIDSHQHRRGVGVPSMK